jgi:hypothetical protein
MDDLVSQVINHGVPNVSDGAAVALYRQNPKGLDDVGILDHIAAHIVERALDQRRHLVVGDGNQSIDRRHDASSVWSGFAAGGEREKMDSAAARTIRILYRTTTLDRGFALRGPGLAPSGV